MTKIGNAPLVSQRKLRRLPLGLNPKCERRRKAFRGMIEGWDCVRGLAKQMGVSPSVAAKRISKALPWDLIEADTGERRAFRIARVVHRTARILGNEGGSFPPPVGRA